MKIACSLPELIGNTPLVRLNRLNISGKATVVVKLEGMNPAGSVKDRIAISLIEAAERDGQIVPGTSVLIEPTSGNTGIGLAAVAAVKGYRLILTMPESASLERRVLLLAYGAELHLTPSLLGMKGAVEKAEQILRNTTNGFMPQQFKNAANPEAHRCKTGPEVWDDTGGEIDILVACVGTGGTLTGISQYIKPKKPSFRAIAVEPDDSALLARGESAPHAIQGIGVNFIPEVLQRELIDEVIPVTVGQATATARELAKKEGILAGLSSGAAVFAALQVAKRRENEGKLIVVILPDSGERYLTSTLFRSLRRQALTLPVTAA